MLVNVGLVGVGFAIVWASGDWYPGYVIGAAVVALGMLRATFHRVDR